MGTTDRCSDGDTPRYRDEEWLREQYHGEGLSQPEIADLCGTGQSVICDWMDRLGVESRSLSEAREGERNPKYRDAEISLTCSWCDKGFTRQRSKAGFDDVYCSQECKDRHHSEKIESGGRTLVTVVCDNCGSDAEVRPDHAERTERSFCDNACYAEYQEETGMWSGENSPRWKGGSVGYYGPDWESQRRRALTRDQYRCQRCGETSASLGQSPDVHHIIPFRTFGAERHEVANRLANLIALCRSCHHTVEKLYSPVRDDWAETGGTTQ